AYRLVKRQHDCRLVLVGGAESDDPEGGELSAEVREAAERDRDLHVLELGARARVEGNALQRAATIVPPKSTRAGYGRRVAGGGKWKRGRGGLGGGITARVV